jgi:hypothetical protein
METVGAGQTQLANRAYETATGRHKSWPNALQGRLWRGRGPLLVIC